MRRISGGLGILVLSAALITPFLLFGGGIKVSYFIGAVVFTLYLCLLVINFEAGFLTLVLIRSSLDYLKNFGGGGMNVAAAVSLTLIVLGVFYVLYTKVNILKYEDTVPFLVFLALCGASVFYSPDMKESLSDWLRLASVFSVYILTRTIFVTREKIHALLITLLYSALLPIGVAYYQLATGHGTVYDGGQDRIVGTFLHPNAFASYLLVLLIFWTAQFLEGTDFVSRPLLMALLTITFVIFIFTFSRGAWIVFVLAMVMMGFLRYRRILGFLPVILLISFLMVPAVKDRIVNIFNPGYTHGRSGWDWRVQTWGEISPMVAEKPLLGHGLSTVEVVFGLLTHNDYLRLLVEVGTFGLLSYVYFAFNLFRQTWLDFQKAHSGLDKCLQVGLLGALVGFLVREFADNTLRNTVVMIYFWIFVGVARNIARLDTETGALAPGPLAEVSNAA